MSGSNHKGPDWQWKMLLEVVLLSEVPKYTKSFADTIAQAAAKVGGKSC